ncbi:hypothetical protein, partial [Arachidicoccus sp.]|uniref:hypothetical protein n=1 Tax=Arachidicoccus sp. TaxID=1872624 RepID=UPI003D24973B
MQRAYAATTFINSESSVFNTSPGLTALNNEELITRGSSKGYINSPQGAENNSNGSGDNSNNPKKLNIEIIAEALPYDLVVQAINK